ncbi:MAG: type I restriction endonuclease subunit R, partial [Deltaproteobacteria bacterium]|nr:type I restriction endonuclease subunit R [Deltaproteobacteria bacterium]
MSSSDFTESEVEQAALDWFADLDYQILPGPSISPGEPTTERERYDQVVLDRRLREALARLNPSLPPTALEEAFRELSQIASPSLVEANRVFHGYLVDGISVEYLSPRGDVVYDPVQLVDFADPDANDWLVVNQFTVAESGHTRRPDVVVFLNGLPLAVIELKNPAAEDATVWDAFDQFQTYKHEIPGLFTFNEALVISDGLEARVGTLTADRERFMPWRT